MSDSGIEGNEGQVIQLAYPEPLPSLKGEQAKQFLRELDGFKLSDEQLQSYREAIRRRAKH